MNFLKEFALKNKFYMIATFVVFLLGSWLYQNKTNDKYSIEIELAIVPVSSIQNFLVSVDFQNISIPSTVISLSKLENVKLPNLCNESVVYDLQVKNNLSRVVVSIKDDFESSSKCLNVIADNIILLENKKVDSYVQLYKKFSVVKLKNLEETAVAFGRISELVNTQSIKLIISNLDKVTKASKSDLIVINGGYKRSISYCLLLSLFLNAFAWLFMFIFINIKFFDRGILVDEK
jgi:hypothetical protein